MTKSKNSSNSPKTLAFEQVKNRALSHINAQKRSNLSVEKYCRQHHIGQSTFYGWIKRYAQSNDANPFIPILPSKSSITQPSTEDKSLNMKIELPQGIILHLEGGADSESIARFIKELAVWS